MILPIKKMVLELDVKFFSVVKELEDELLGCSLIYLCLLHGVSTEEEIEKITGYSPEKIRKAIDFLGKKDYIDELRADGQIKPSIIEKIDKSFNNSPDSLSRCSIQSATPGT